LPASAREGLMFKEPKKKVIHKTVNPSFLPEPPKEFPRILWD
jgi:hypothetical protein